MREPYIRLADTLRAAGLVLFAYRSDNKRKNAEINLNGRTHFIDNCAAHFSTIEASMVRREGTLLVIHEKLDIDYADRHKGRGWRWTAFDLFGNALRGDEMIHPRRAAAKTAFDEWFKIFDVHEHYAAELQRQSGLLLARATRLTQASTQLDHDHHLPNS